MVFCLNPSCCRPDNPPSHDYCHGCGSNLAQSSRKYLFRSHYEVKGILGQGGFGRTYLAEDLDYYRRPCVIKKLLISNSDPQVTKIKDLFAREATQLYSLTHPQIPKLYAYFDYEGGLYLVQEYIDGQNLLQELNQRGRFNEEKIIHLLLDILPVLAYIQDQNILHRDLKPENIMRRNSDGMLMLIDFGAARVKSAQGATALTLIYTPGYAAIEHMHGRPTKASDIYSLGATCVRLITGCLPSKDNDPIFDDYRNRWLWQEYLENKGIKFNPRLAFIINKMIDSSLGKRYSSAHNVIEDLSSLTNKNQTPDNNYPVIIFSKNLPKIKLLTWSVIGSAFALLWILLISIKFGYQKTYFKEKINKFEDSAMLIIISRNKNNNYNYESFNKKNQEFLELQESNCDYKISKAYDLKCTWEHKGYQYQVFYNSLKPDQISLQILTPDGHKKQDRILTRTNTQPLW